jgi:hypothetical protein
MPRDGALVLSDLRQPTLSIVCEPCGRRLGISENKARLAATWTLAARGFVAEAVNYLPHLVFVGPKAPRDRAVSLVAASIENLLVELTRVHKRRGVILIEDYDELSKGDEESAAIVRDLLLRPDTPMCRPVLMGCRHWSFSFPDPTPALVVSLDIRS